MPTTFTSTVANTALGPVATRVAGSGSTVFLALPGLGRAGNKDWERVIAASDLTSEANLTVLLPDPLSNVRTAPSLSEFAVVRTCTTLFGAVKYPCREEWLKQLLPEPSKGRCVLAGHSWGGGAAARFAVAHPELVQKLVLVSPDVEYSVAQQLKVPTLLVWAKDDFINPFLWTRRFKGHPALTLHAPRRGGHMVQDSHVDVIARWLRHEYDDDQTT